MMNALTVRELAPLVKRLVNASGAFDEERLMRAFHKAQKVYGDEMHWTGVSVLEHCIGSLEILSPFEPDEDAVIACLLHHVLHTKNMTLLELEEEFGPRVRSLVSGVHLLAHVTVEKRRGTIEDLRLVLLSVSDDIRVILIAICDRCYCLEFLHQMEPEKKKRLCQDVLQLFAPVTSRLGIYSLKYRLEDRAFPVLYPNDAEHIIGQLSRVQTDHPRYLDRAQTALKEFLADQGIDASVEAREKHPYSIFQKMRRKSLTFVQDVHDLFALRVIVGQEEDCYRVLGLLHRLGRPLANRFKDYIAFPKPNGYQSLHTTLVQFAGMAEGIYIEVQVRTEVMHREARYGVAAHWSYKEHGATQRAMEKVQLHSMLIGQQEVAGESNSSLADHIFVLTPLGDIVELPEEATPLDFAFQVHTDLGLSFQSARVNGSIVPLDYQLENGDVVEIIKHKTPSPSPQWMQQLKMATSRSKLRRYLYAQDRPRLIVRGRELVNEELRKRKMPMLDTDLSPLRVVEGEVLPMQRREDILFKIGQGSEKAASLIPKLKAFPRAATADQVPEDVSDESSGRMQRKDALVGIEDGLSMPLRYAKCCKPETAPHGDIIGHVNRTGEVMIHRKGCRMIKSANKGRRIKVWWK